MVKKKPPIWIGAIFWKDFLDKALCIKPVEEALNKGVDLSHYGSGLRSIKFVPFAVNSENNIHEEKIAYNGHDKELIVKIRLDSNIVAKTPPDQFPEFVALTFFQLIDRFSRHRIKDFDLPAFKNRVEDLFVEQGWLSRGAGA